MGEEAFVKKPYLLNEIERGFILAALYLAHGEAVRGTLSPNSESNKDAAVAFKGLMDRFHTENLN